MKNKKGTIDILVMAIFAVLVVSAAGFYIVNIQGNQEIMPAEGVTPPTETPTYTLEEISQHTEENDCWMAVDGKVYDVTDYIQSGDHPAGRAILKGCGLDASEMFEGPHSQNTYDNLLPDFEIGILQ